MNKRLKKGDVVDLEDLKLIEDSPKEIQDNGMSLERKNDSEVRPKSVHKSSRSVEKKRKRSRSKDKSNRHRKDKRGDSS